jgi:hypothetical protein
LWQTANTAEVEYLALPGNDGELYVYPGYYDECRCSESEVNFACNERSGVDLGDDHYNHTTLPSDVIEKSILYTEEDGILRERKLLGDIHPLHDAMHVRFEIAITEDRILSWLKPEHTKKCSSYTNFLWFHKTKHSKVPEEIWEHYDFDNMLLDLWRKEECDIVYDDGNDVFVRLKDIGQSFPDYKGKEVAWFLEHPSKEYFCIVY